VLLEGSVHRHNAYLGYQKFERSVTTVLATMLSKETCRLLLNGLRERFAMDEAMKRTDSNLSGTEKKEEDGASEERAVDASGSSSVGGNGPNRKANAEKLQVVTIGVLLEVLQSLDLEDNREVKEVASMIMGMSNFKVYVNFAYHISLLRQFVSTHTLKSGKSGGSSDETVSSVHGNNVWASLKKKRGLDSSGHGKGSDYADSSVRSVRSLGGMGGMRRVNTATGNLSSL
jgi:hypothetical protein